MATPSPPRPSPPRLSPSRRVTLAIGLVFSLGTIGTGALYLVHQLGRASYQEQATLDSPATRLLTVHTGGGDVTVRASPDDQVHVTADVRYGVTRPRLTHLSAPDGVLVRADCQGFLLLASCSVDYTIAVPADFAIRADSRGGDIHALDGLAGVVTLNTGGGDLTVSGARGSLDLHTGGGSIRGTDLHCAEVVAETGAGNVILTFSDAPQQVSTVVGAGNVVVEVPATASYRVDASTGAGRSTVGISNDLTSPRLIRAHSGAGNVTVRPVAG
ncbi:MAG: hypothetical protein HYR62_09305 [Actinobacteria bacterium]|nr:hypothetical protein [Actinomycetota bacterium]MBI3688079.1 hypothetical protein [Actinomycetota bacterium]